MKANERKVKIPAETLEAYRELFQRGDYAAISNNVFGSPEYRQKIQYHLLKGEGPVSVVEAIVRYYDEVKKSSENILNEYDLAD